MSWFVIANTHSARIYEYDKASENLSLVKELAVEILPLKGADLLSDRLGRVKSGVKHRAIFHPDTDPKEVQAINFAKEVAKELENGRATNQYRNLIVAMQPHMMGLLNQFLSDHVKKITQYEIKKDYMMLPEHELAKTYEKDIQKLKPLSRPE